MPETILRETIETNGTPDRPGHPGQPSTKGTLVARLTVEAVSGGGYGAWQNIARSLPAAFDDLTRDFGDDVYAKMLLDPQVSAALDTLKTAIMADGVEITPAIIDITQSGYKRARTIADFVGECMLNLQPALDTVLWDLLDAYAFGCKVAEQIYALEGGRLRLVSLKVKPRHVTAFVVDGYMNVLGLLAAIPGEYGGAAPGYVGADPAKAPNLLPRDKFAVLSSWPKDGDPRGVSLLRPAYRPWWDKQQMIPEYLKYLTQFASASIIAVAPEITQPYAADPAQPAAEATSVVGQIGRALEGFKNGSYVVLPNGTTAKPVEVAGEGIPFMHAFERFDRQISTAILHQTLATQESQHETRAAAQVHQDVLALLVRIGKRTVAAMLRRDVFYPLVKYNWGEADARRFTPTANLSEVEAEDISARMTAVGGLAREGLIFPSQLPDLFTDLDLPAASAEDLAAYARRWSAPPPAPVAAQSPTPSPPQGGTPARAGGPSPPTAARPPGTAPASRPPGTPVRNEAA